MNVTSFILSLFSFFIIAHFIYRLSGKKNWSYFFLGVIFLSNLFEFIPFVLAKSSTTVLVYVFTSRILPVLLASLLFFRVVGGGSSRKIKTKRKQFKEPNEDIFTTTYIKKIIYMMFLLAIAISTLAYFFIDDLLEYILYILSIFVVTYGLIKLYQLRAYKDDKVVIIIGREKENTFVKVIDQKLSKLTIKDIYYNENYLIDKFATVHIYQDKKFSEKHYLYWIATSIPFEIEDKTFKKIELGYKEHIMHLEKYHDAIIKLDFNGRRYDVRVAKNYKK